MHFRRGNLQRRPTPPKGWVNRYRPPTLRARFIELKTRIRDIPGNPEIMARREHYKYIGFECKIENVYLFSVNGSLDGLMSVFSLYTLNTVDSNNTHVLCRGVLWLSFALMVCNHNCVIWYQNNWNSIFFYRYCCYSLSFYCCLMNVDWDSLDAVDYQQHHGIAGFHPFWWFWWTRFSTPQWVPFAVAKTDQNAISSIAVRLPHTQSLIPDSIGYIRNRHNQINKIKSTNYLSLY